MQLKWFRGSGLPCHAVLRLVHHVERYCDLAVEHEEVPDELQYKMPCATISFGCPAIDWYPLCTTFHAIGAVPPLGACTHNITLDFFFLELDACTPHPTCRRGLLCSLLPCNPYHGQNGLEALSVLDQA